ncbi:MAG: pilus assembly protein PilP [Cellvibrio sp.]|nr:pilus assembly protein PilP [Cellvibrio sp.]
MKSVKWLVLITFATLLVACSLDNKHQDLDDYIAETQKRPSGEIPDLPPFVPYQPFVYSASTLRSPFEKPVLVDENTLKGGRTVVPDFTRAPEYLEEFNITSLKMVGTVTWSGGVWALIDNSQGSVVKARVGNYMGKNHGKIVSVTANQIEVMEMVSNGVGGWVENPRVIKLDEKE